MTSTTEFEMQKQPPVTPRGTGSVSVRFDRWFHFSERGSTLSREVLAGMTTFSTMSYVLVVHPLVLSSAGMDRGALITATAVIAAIFSVIMGLRTNYPLAMAPGMGVNAYVAVQVCQGMHIPWQAALGMVFYTGLLFMVISLTGIRQKIIEAFPPFFKRIVGAGIGSFIAFLGLKNAGIIVANPAYANPKQVDAAMPCFRLGAFGTERMQAKRIHGLFSFLCRATDTNRLGLELIGHAAFRLHQTDVETLAAQAPSDAPHLLRFYHHHFRKQGSFPVFERNL